MNTKIEKILIVFLIILLTIFIVNNLRMEKELKEAKKPTITEKLIKQRAETKTNVEASRLKLDLAKEKVVKLQSEYELAVWEDRCIKIKSILSLSGTGWKLDCSKNLNKYASYNLKQTKIDLGL